MTRKSGGLEIGDRTRFQVLESREEFASISGASVTSTGIFPANCIKLGVATIVTTALGTGNSTTGYEVGNGTDDDMYGAITGTTVATHSDSDDYTVDIGVEHITVAQDIEVTAVGGDFDGTGTILVTAYYMVTKAL